MAAKLNLSIGADPELFLTDKGKFISAHKHLKGTKKDPFPVKSGAVQVDGMAAEFNIDPATTAKEFVTNIQTVMKELSLLIPKKFELEISPVAHFSPQYMFHIPDSAKELGCDPDFNAYTLTVNPRPDQHKTMRTAAGHIHVGWTKVDDPMSPEHFNSCAHMVRQLDATLGLWSVLTDPDTERKQMYGKAGAFRPKPYGLEYRVLSNFWLASPKLMETAFNITKNAFIALATNGVDYSDIFFHAEEEGDPVNVQDIINSNNVEEAETAYFEYELSDLEYEA